MLNLWHSLIASFLSILLLCLYRLKLRALPFPWPNDRVRSRLIAPSQSEVRSRRMWPQCAAWTAGYMKWADVTTNRITVITFDIRGIGRFFVQNVASAVCLRPDFGPLHLYLLESCPRVCKSQLALRDYFLFKIAGPDCFQQCIRAIESLRHSLTSRQNPALEKRSVSCVNGFWISPFRVTIRRQKKSPIGEFAKRKEPFNACQLAEPRARQGAEQHRVVY